MSWCFWFRHNEVAINHTYFCVGAILLLRRLWQWLTPRLQTSVAADLIFNATKSQGYCPKVAQSGATLVLSNVIQRLHTSRDAFHIQAVRRCAVALCRITRFASDALLSEGGVNSLTLATKSNVSASDDGQLSFGKQGSSRAFHRIGFRGVPGVKFCRMSATAMSRLLWKAESHTGAAEHGACQVASLLCNSEDV